MNNASYFELIDTRGQQPPGHPTSGDVRTLPASVWSPRSAAAIRRGRLPGAGRRRRRGREARLIVGCTIGCPEPSARIGDVVAEEPRCHRRVRQRDAARSDPDAVEAPTCTAAADPERLGAADRASGHGLRGLTGTGHRRRRRARGLAPMPTPGSRGPGASSPAAPPAVDAPLVAARRASLRPRAARRCCQPRPARRGHLGGRSRTSCSPPTSGVGPTQQVVDGLRTRLRVEGARRRRGAALLREELRHRWSTRPWTAGSRSAAPTASPAWSWWPGVNGSGKTTSIAKLARMFNRRQEHHARGRRHVPGTGGRTAHHLERAFGVDIVTGARAATRPASPSTPARSLKEPAASTHRRHRRPAAQASY